MKNGHDSQIAFPASVGEDGYRHTHPDIMLLEVDDVFIAEADTTLTATSRHAFLVVGAAVNSYAAPFVSV